MEQRFCMIRTPIHLPGLTPPVRDLADQGIGKTILHTPKATPSPAQKSQLGTLFSCRRAVFCSSAPDDLHKWKASLALFSRGTAQNHSKNGSFRGLPLPNSARSWKGARYLCQSWIQYSGMRK